MWSRELEPLSGAASTQTQAQGEAAELGRQDRVLMTIELELTKQEREKGQTKTSPAALFSQLAHKIALK